MILRIQIVMDHYGLSVSSFADGIGVQRSSISHLLNGRNRPSLDFVMKLIAAYPEVDLYWLLKGEGSFPRKEKMEASGQRPIGSTGNPEPSKGPPPHKPSDGADLGNPINIVVFYGDGSFRSFNKKKD